MEDAAGLVHLGVNTWAEISSAILHSPLIVLVAFVLQGVELAPGLKLVVVAATVIPLCFVVTYTVRKIPFVSKVL